MTGALRRPSALALAAGLAILMAFLLAGIKGAAGMGLGLGATTLCLWALWKAISLLGRAAAVEAPARFGTFLILLVFFVKLPAFILAGNLAHSIGGPAPTCFLVGLALVYSALVGWAVTQR